MSEKSEIIMNSFMSYLKPGIDYLTNSSKERLISVMKKSAYTDTDWCLDWKTINPIVEDLSENELFIELKRAILADAVYNLTKAIFEDVDLEGKHPVLFAFCSGRFIDELGQTLFKPADLQEASRIVLSQDFN